MQYRSTCSCRLFMLTISTFGILIVFIILNEKQLSNYNRSLNISDNEEKVFAKAIRRLLNSHSIFYDSKSSTCRADEFSNPDDEELLDSATRILPLLKTKIIGYPDKYCKGRGIVLTAGPSQLLHTKFNLRIIAWSKTKLPIEVWYSSEQITETVARDIVNFVPNLKVKVCCFQTGQCHSLNNQSISIPFEYIHIPKTRNISGKIYSFKLAAILSSSFREIVFLDSDCYIVKDPTYIFKKDPMYKHFGSLFYPDIYLSHQSSRVWSLLNTTCVQNEYSIDSGVVILDKKRVWKGIYLAKLMSDYHQIFYQRVFSDGDKDTFRLAFRTMSIPYYIVSIPCSLGYIEKNSFCGVTLCKTDSLGLNVYFDHVHHPKHLIDLTFRKEHFTHMRVALVDPYRSVSFITGYCGLDSSPCFQVGFQDETSPMSIRDYCLKSASIYDGKPLIKLSNNQTLLWNPNVDTKVLLMKKTETTLPGYIDFYFKTQEETIFKGSKL